jgi:DNA replicative helicase MCM subunit Mcm2 (Cdc46/Mcm family)
LSLTGRRSILIAVSDTKRDGMDATSELRLNLKRQFVEFLDLANGHGDYASRIATLTDSDEKCFRLKVDVADVRGYDYELHQRLMNEPAEALPAFEQALEETVRSHKPKWLPEGQGMRVALTGEFGAHTVSPRQLLAPLMGKMVR